jgi:hypothetical protein
MMYIPALIGTEFLIGTAIKSFPAYRTIPGTSDHDGKIDHLKLKSTGWQYSVLIRNSKEKITA